MVKRLELPAFLLLAFGLPFLFLTDLFPFHRFGMFAGLANLPEKSTRYTLQVKEQGQWKNLTIGNPYFDEGYFPTLAQKAFGDTAKEQELYRKLQSALPNPEVKVRLFKRSTAFQTDSVHCLSADCL